MPGKYGSPSAFFFVDGYNLISAKLQSLRYKLMALTEKTDGIGDTWEEHTPTGKKRAEVAQEGAFFDTSANNIHDALSGKLPANPQAAVRIVSMGFAGDVIGMPMVGFEGAFTTEYEVLAQLDELQKANAAYVVTGALQDGVVLHTLAQETAASGNTEGTSSDHTTEAGQRTVPITSSSVANPSVITTPVPHGLTTGDSVLISGHSGSTPSINAEHDVTVVTATTFTIPVNVTVGGTGGTFVVGKTADGGAAFLQVTQLTLGGYTDVTVTIRDSADDAVYGDLVAFTNFTTSPTAERKTVAGTIERYLAQSFAFNGAGSSQSVTYHAGFARD